MSVLYAHTVSASRSELNVEDGLSRLTVRMPMQELEHLPQSGRDLARYFRIAGEGPVAQSCSQQGSEWVCRATYLGVPGAIECHMAEATVPHHVHTMTFEGRTLVFTAADTKVDPTSHAHWPWSIAAAIAVIALWVIRNLRLRRSRTASS